MSIISFFTNEPLLILGFNENLEYKFYKIYKNSKRVVYRVYYLIHFIKDIEKNFSLCDDNELYKIVPIVFDDYLDTLSILEEKNNDDETIKVVKEILVSLNKINEYIIKSFSDKKISIRYLNLMLKTIKEDIKKNKEEIDKFIDKYQIKIPLNSIKVDITINPNNLKTKVLIKSKHIYPLFRGSYFNDEKPLPISLGEILINDFFLDKDDNNEKITLLTKYYLSLDYFNTDFSSNDIDKICEYLLNEIKKNDLKDKNPTEKFFYLLNSYKAVLDNFFLNNKTFFTQNEIKEIYKKVLISLNENFFIEYIKDKK